MFSYPTIKSLAEAVCALVDPSYEGPTTVDLGQQIQDMIDKYGADIPVAKHPRSSGIKFGAVVLLTGTTGNIGSHILASLLADGRVAKVYAMNRGTSIEQVIERQRAAFEDRGLPVNLLDNGRFVPATGSLGQERFGLSRGEFDEVRSPNGTRCIDD